MLATSANFQAMVEGVEHTLAWSVSITLPGGVDPDMTLAVKAVSIDGQTTSDVPEGTRLQEGYTTLQATVTLSGLVDETDATKTAAWLFGPYSTTSPLYRSDAFRAPVVITLGLYPANAGGVPEVLTKFVGYVDTYDIDSDGNIVLVCIDNRSNLRGTVSLPAVATAEPFNAGLTSEFAIDAILRAATDGAVSTWPDPRPQCVFAVGLQTSLWPEIGTLDTAASQPYPVFARGGWGTGLARNVYSGSGSVWAKPQWNTTVPLGDTFHVEFLVDLPATGQSVNIVAGNGAGGDSLRINVSTGPFGLNLVVAAGVGSGTWNTGLIPTAGPHLIGVKFTMTPGSASWSATARIDGTTVSSGTLTVSAGGARSSTDWTIVTADPEGSGASAQIAVISGLQLTNQTGAGTSYPFTPAAVIDTSLNPLSLVPAVEGDPWAAIQQIAQAELGVAGFDDSGVFRFTNRRTLSSRAAARTVSSTTSLVDLGIHLSAAGVVNLVRVGWTGWTYATSKTAVYSATAHIKVAAHSTKEIRATLDTVAVELDPSLSVLPDGSGSTTSSFYRASTTRAGVAEHPGGLTFTVAQEGANTLVITITNSSNQDAWLVSPANYVDLPVGTPVLRIAGTAVTADDEIVVQYEFPPPADGGAASSRFGEVAYELTGNPWIQDDDTALQLATDIVVDTCLPRPDLTGVTIIPDPRLQLADVVLIQDLDRTGVNEYARIFASNISFTAGEEDGTATYDQTIDARTLAPPGAWIGEVAGRSEGDLTTYGY